MKLFNQINAIFFTIQMILSNYFLFIQCYFIWIIFLSSKLQKSSIFNNKSIFTTMQWFLSSACSIKMNIWIIQQMKFSHLSFIKNCTTYKNHYSTHSCVYHYLFKLICIIHRLQLNTSSQTQMNHCINIFCFSLLKLFMNITIHSSTFTVQLKKSSISINTNWYNSQYLHKYI